MLVAVSTPRHNFSAPSTSSTSPSPSVWSGGIAIDTFDFAFTIDWCGRIATYDIYGNNHAYIINFKHTKEFLTSTSQEGPARSALDKQSGQR
jgi:hypothetical protein